MVPVVVQEAVAQHITAAAHYEQLGGCWLHQHYDAHYLTTSTIPAWWIWTSAVRNRHGILCSPEYFPLMISAPGDEVNPVAVWTQKPVVSEFLAGWVGQIVGWVFLLSKILWGWRRNGCCKCRCWKWIMLWTWVMAAWACSHNDCCALLLQDNFAAAHNK